MRTLLTVLFLTFLVGAAQAENLVELRYVLAKQIHGALAAKFGSDDLWLSPTVVVADSDIKSSSVSRDEQGFVIALTLKKSASKRFDTLAATHVGERLAIMVRGKVVSTPVVREKHFGGKIQIVGNFTEEEAVAIASALNEPGK